MSPLCHRFYHSWDPIELQINHDDVIKWKHFPRYWPFVWGIHRSGPGEFPAQRPVTRSFDFFICVWINGWVNNRKAGDLKPYRAHYDVTVMIIYPLNCFWETYKYVCIFYHYIHWDGVVAILPDGRHGPLILLNKHHGRWWPDDRRSQSSTSYCIALVFPEYPGLRTIMVNTLRPRQNGRHFPNSIFKCIFLNQNLWISINISLKFVSHGPIDSIPALVQIMAWRRPGDKPLSEPMVVSLLTYIYMRHSASMSSLQVSRNWSSSWLKMSNNIRNFSTEWLSHLNIWNPFSRIRQVYSKYPTRYQRRYSKWPTKSR